LRASEKEEEKEELLEEAPKEGKREEEEVPKCIRRIKLISFKPFFSIQKYYHIMHDSGVLRVK